MELQDQFSPFYKLLKLIFKIITYQIIGKDFLIYNSQLDK